MTNPSPHLSQTQRVGAPAEVGDVELTALCYHGDGFLFTATSRGHVCAWDAAKRCCFMTWEADEGEIGTNEQMTDCHHFLITSSV